VTAFECEGCGGRNTHYRVFSGGREYYCPDCEYEGSYPPPEEMDPSERPRAMLLQTEDGRVALKAQMDQELARLRDEAAS
jgi:hypothetical protein